MNRRSLYEMNKQLIHFLHKELGVVDAVRFLNQFTPGYGNYTLEREIMLPNKTLDELEIEIKKLRKTGQGDQVEY